MSRSQYITLEKTNVLQLVRFKLMPRKTCKEGVNRPTSRSPQCHTCPHTQGTAMFRIGNNATMPGRGECHLEVARSEKISEIGEEVPA